MNFNLENITQTRNLFNEHIFYPMYIRLEDASRSKYIYLLAPVVAFTDGFFSLVEATASVAEAALKGVVNILGSIFSTKFNGYRGRLQIVGALAAALLSPIVIVSRTLRVTYHFFNTPALFSSSQAQNYLQAKPKTIYLIIFLIKRLIKKAC